MGPTFGTWCRREAVVTPRELRSTPVILHVLLSLVEGAKHGYAILTDVEARSRGQFSLGPSTLYYNLGRLADAGLIQEMEDPEPHQEAEPHAAQRRYFTITDAGRERLRSEMDVLSDLVDHARALGLSPEG